jgi:hypothetical protein
LLKYLLVSWFVFDEFIAKGGENVHKVGRILLLTG